MTTAPATTHAHDAPAPPWWRAEVPGGIVFAGRLVFFIALFVGAMGRGGQWVSESAGIALSSLAVGAAVTSGWLHESRRRVSNAIQALVFAPWFVAALARGAHEGNLRSAWGFAGGGALLVLTAFHLRSETILTRWACLLFAFLWCAIP